MKKPFKDPTEPKKHEPRAEPMDGRKSPWDFRCPPYDQRSSCFVKAGTNYGEGHRQPVGHKENPKMRSEMLPKGGHSVNIDEENY